MTRQLRAPLLAALLLLIAPAAAALLPCGLPVDAVRRIPARAALPRCCAEAERAAALRAELARLQAEEAALNEEEAELLDELEELADLDDDELALFGLDRSGAPAAAPLPPLAAAPPPTSRVAPDAPLADTLPADAIVCIAGCDTLLGRTLLEAVRADAAASSWRLRPLGVPWAGAAPGILCNASALVILSEGAAGPGGVPTGEVGELLDALPEESMCRLVYVSVHGAERTSELPFSLQNALGGRLDRARAAEGEVRLRAEGRLPSVSVLRLGGVRESSDGAPCELAPGDALRGEVGALTAAELLLRTLTASEVINTTFSAGPPPAGGVASWDDELLKLRGPEVYRRRLGDGLAVGEPLVDWVRTWARERGAVGLTSKVQIENVPNGALVRFVCGAATYDATGEASSQRRVSAGTSGEGALLVVAESSPYERVRVARAEMEGNTQPKEMSEATLLERLDRDLSALERARGG